MSIEGGEGRGSAEQDLLHPISNDDDGLHGMDAHLRLPYHPAFIIRVVMGAVTAHRCCWWALTDNCMWWVDTRGCWACTQGGIGRPWVLVGICCHVWVLAWPHCHCLSFVMVVRWSLSDTSWSLFIVVLGRFMLSSRPQEGACRGDVGRARRQPPVGPQGWCCHVN